MHSHRRLFTLLAVLAMLAGAFILLRPRLWVKNKTAKVIVDGRLSENVKLFHGSDERVLFYLLDDRTGAYYYNPQNGVERCDASQFASLKIIVFSAHAFPRCASEPAMTTVNGQSLEFHRRAQDIIVSWQAAPR